VVITARLEGILTETLLSNPQLQLAVRESFARFAKISVERVSLQNIRPHTGNSRRLLGIVAFDVHFQAVDLSSANEIVDNMDSTANDDLLKELKRRLDANNVPNDVVPQDGLMISTGIKKIIDVRTKDKQADQEFDWGTSVAILASALFVIALFMRCRKAIFQQLGISTKVKETYVKAAEMTEI